MDQLLRTVLRCVQRRLRDDDDVTVEAITRDIGMTRQHVSGHFRRTTGRLLSQFLREKRLDKAAKLLKRGHLRVALIARRCGFDSENYFRRQFHARYGMSPTEFRESGTLGSTRNRTT